MIDPMEQDPPAGHESETHPKCKQWKFSARRKLARSIIWEVDLQRTYQPGATKWALITTSRQLIGIVAQSPLEAWLNKARFHQTYIR